MALGGGLLAYRGLNKYFLKDFLDKKEIELWKWSKESKFYKTINNSARCLLCPHGCILKHGETGGCRARINKDNKLYSIVYGNPCAVHVDPIEKKPLFHFLPESRALSIATAGCNFTCKNCQNWTISQSSPQHTENIDFMPEKVVRNALSYNCQTIAYTYSEPSVFYEYMYDTSKLAHENKIKNLYISNGYINEEPLRELCKVIDAANIDLKGFDKNNVLSLTGGDYNHVLRTLKILKQEGVWLEITNLIVPGYTDDLDKIREMSAWISDNLGGDVPIHFSRFSPQYKLKHLLPTPVKTLEKAREIALSFGIKHVYIGNVLGKDYENTYCSKGHLCIERKGFSVTKFNLEEGKCSKCGEKIAGIWEV
ncbi:AmmeMemoRadiSam system radical SAM enzyme [Candidatus Woesearchaeota archaeon]|nr:AmmeMemoRadiSam system radical SAM enzyme [Candidatus Woesearchaeota archaeon]